MACIYPTSNTLVFLAKRAHVLRMAKSSSTTRAEREYLERRLAPVLTALRRDDHLRDDFLMFSRERGGDIALTLERLKTVWWPSRKSMYPGFFVLTLVDFGLARDLIGRSKEKKGKS
jgi:hypothetical protein